MSAITGRPLKDAKFWMTLQGTTSKFLCVKFYAHYMGVELSWTLNQEMLFSFALTGKPAREEVFGEYRWNCCVIGSREDYVKATTHKA